MDVAVERLNLSKRIHSLYHDALHHPERFKRHDIHIEPMVFYPFSADDHRCNLMVSIARHVLGNQWYFVVTKVLHDIPYLYIGESYVLASSSFGSGGCLSPGVSAESTGEE